MMLHEMYARERYADMLREAENARLSRAGRVRTQPTTRVARRGPLARFRRAT
jgi:hypothetical protein